MPCERRERHREREREREFGGMRVVLIGRKLRYLWKKNYVTVQYATLRPTKNSGSELHVPKVSNGGTFPEV